MIGIVHSVQMMLLFNCVRVGACVCVRASERLVGYCYIW